MMFPEQPHQENGLCLLVIMVNSYSDHRILRRTNNLNINNINVVIGAATLVRTDFLCYLRFAFDTPHLHTERKRGQNSILPTNNNYV